VTPANYVRTKLGRLPENVAKGIPIPNDIVNVAEHLCIVEHTDHKRFMNEKQANFPRYYPLYALNEAGTYRYSVSTAGAGGMIQMILWTYEGSANSTGAVLNPIS
jgi:hypothetical protein